MFPEPQSTPDQEKPQEPSSSEQPSPFGSATPQESTFSQKPEPTEAPSPFTAAYTPAASTLASVVTAPTEADTYDSTALSLYIVTMLAGASLLISASYLVWNALDYFTKPAAEFSFFDFSSLTIYALIYLVLFTTLYALGSLRLDKRIAQVGSVERPLRTASAVWRALLVVWGVAALVGLLYSPLSASLDGGEGSSLASEITSAVVGLVLIGLLFWRDLFVQKMRSGLIAVGVIAGLAVVIAGANAFASLNPKQAKEETYDYSSSMYNYDLEDTSRSTDTSTSTETSTEFNFDSLESTEEAESTTVN